MRIDIHSTPVRGGILCLQFEPLFQSRGVFFLFFQRDRNHRLGGFAGATPRPLLVRNWGEL